MAMTLEPKAYAGIGSRSTPQPILNLISLVAKAMADHGWILRTGGAEGADEAFALGCESDLLNGAGVGGVMELYLPWDGFNGLHSRWTPPKPEAYELAGEIHPAWLNCSEAAQKLHARNMHQILGWNLDDPVKLVLCWTPDGATTETGTSTGGTGQAIRLANMYEIPVFNFYWSPHKMRALRQIINEEEDPWALGVVNL